MSQLGQYMADHGLKDADMAQRLAPMSRSYVTLMRLGLRRPSLDVALKIEKVTDGEVPVSSWRGKSVA